MMCGDERRSIGAIGRMHGIIELFLRRFICTLRSRCSLIGVIGSRMVELIKSSILPALAFSLDM